MHVMHFRVMLKMSVSVLPSPRTRVAILHLPLKEGEVFQEWHPQPPHQPAGLPDAVSPAVLRTQHRQPLGSRTAPETPLQAERPFPHTCSF